MAQAGPFGKQDPTTAQLLGAYRRELEAEGMGLDMTQTLVIEAARQLLRDEPLEVGVPIPDGVTVLRLAIPVDAALVADRHAVERAASEAALAAVVGMARQ